jgi:hypothetical protein
LYLDFACSCFGSEFFVSMWDDCPNRGNPPAVELSPPELLLNRLKLGKPPNEPFSPACTTLTMTTDKPAANHNDLFMMLS